MRHVWPPDGFRAYCLRTGLAKSTASGYPSHLRRLNEIVDGLDKLIAAKANRLEVDDYVSGLPIASFRSLADRRDKLSVLRKYLDFLANPHAGTSIPSPQRKLVSQPVHVPLPELGDLFHDVRSLALRYYRTTGKPLGVTGELAELAAATLIGVELSPARTAGFDGWLDRDGQRLRVQIKGRAVPWATRYGGRCPSIKCGDLFDVVMLVLIDNETMQPREIWEADEKAVMVRLAEGESKARNERGAMGINQFKNIGRLIWTSEA